MVFGIIMLIANLVIIGPGSCAIASRIKYNKYSDRVSEAMTIHRNNVQKEMALHQKLYQAQAAGNKEEEKRLQNELKTSLEELNNPKASKE